MRQVRIWAAMLLAGVMAACGDLPTAPGGTTGISTGGAGPAHDYILPPIVVVGKPRGCDPWLDPNWCEGTGGGGQCMTAVPGGATGPEFTTISSCPIGDGGGGPGGGGGNSGGSTGGSGPGGNKSNTNDTGDCPGCGERQPTAGEKTDMQNLLSTVTCADGKAALEAAFAAQTLLVYTVDDGRWGSYDSTTGLIYISRPKHWLPSGLDQRELGDTMVHEIVHKVLGHTNGQESSHTHGSDFKNKMASCGYPQA